MTSQKFKVVSVGLGTKDDRREYQVPHSDECYRAQLERVEPTQGVNPLGFIPESFVVITREPQPMIGDTYTLIFTKDKST